MVTKKLWLAGAVALVAAGLAAPAAPAYPLDPVGERLVVPMTSRTGVAKPKATVSTPAKPKPRKPPFEP
jgi:hypothetical protein